jgi:hypothetical protein
VVGATATVVGATATVVGATATVVGVTATVVGVTATVVGVTATMVGATATMVGVTSKEGKAHDFNLIEDLGAAEVPEQDVVELLGRAPDKAPLDSAAGDLDEAPPSGTKRRWRLMPIRSRKMKGKSFSRGRSFFRNRGEQRSEGLLE